MKFSEYDWMIGLSVAVGLALLFTLFTKPDMRVFFIWFGIWTAVMVYADILPNWVLYVLMIAMVMVFYLEFTKIKNAGVEVG
ncbi:MAG: hypothetical protein ACOC1X_00340 [Promethearchaeota archaeon]